MFFYKLYKKEYIVRHFIKNIFKIFMKLVGRYHESNGFMSKSEQIFVDF